MQSNIARLLRQRGHEVTREGSRHDVLLPENSDEDLVAAFETILYNLMRHDSARKALRDWAYRNTSSDNSATHQIESYINLCRRFGEWPKQSDSENQRRYAATFEWYVSELLKREFGARASGFGIRLKDADPDDEFDCIALLDAGLAYVECKTGKATLYSEIAKFIRRDSELCANISFFVFDRDYTFDRGQADAPNISAQQASALGLESIHRVDVRGEEFFRIVGSNKRNDKEIDSRFFLTCTASRGLESRIRYMIRYISEVQEEGRPLSEIFSVSQMPFTEEPGLRLG